MKRNITILLAVLLSASGLIAAELAGGPSAPVAMGRGVALAAE